MFALASPASLPTFSYLTGRLDPLAERCKYDEMSTRLRHRLVARRHAVSTLLLVLLIAFSFGLAACGGSSPSTTSTTVHKLPPVPAGADKSPSVTVESYLDALSHHDTKLAEKLIYSKVRKAIMGAEGSGFSDLTNLQDIKVLATATNPQYKPVVSGVTFTKFHQFAQVTVSYSATFSSGNQPSGPQKRLITVGENAGSKWVILEVKTSV